MTTPLPPMPAIDVDRIGPAIGDRFPDLTLPDQYGQPLDLHQYRAGRRAFVLLHRSAAW